MMIKHRSSLYQSEADRADMALVRQHDGDRGLSDLVNRLIRQRANQIREAENKGRDRKMQITRTVEQLLVARDNDLSLYWTPGAPAPYWANQPSFMYDECVATVGDFLAAAGFNGLEGFDPGEIFTLEIQPISAR